MVDTRGLVHLPFYRVFYSRGFEGQSIKRIGVQVSVATVLMREESRESQESKTKARAARSAGLRQHFVLCFGRLFYVVEVFLLNQHGVLVFCKKCLNLASALYFIYGMSFLVGVVVAAVAFPRFPSLSGCQTRVQRSPAWRRPGLPICCFLGPSFQSFE